MLCLSLFLALGAHLATGSGDAAPRAHEVPAGAVDPVVPTPAAPVPALPHVPACDKTTIEPLLADVLARTQEVVAVPELVSTVPLEPCALVALLEDLLRCDEDEECVSLWEFLLDLVAGVVETVQAIAEAVDVVVAPLVPDGPEVVTTVAAVADRADAAVDAVAVPVSAVEVPFETVGIEPTVSGVAPVTELEPEPLPLL